MAAYPTIDRGRPLAGERQGARQFLEGQIVVRKVIFSLDDLLQRTAGEKHDAAIARSRVLSLAAALKSHVVGLCQDVGERAVLRDRSGASSRASIMILPLVLVT